MLCLAFDQYENISVLNSLFLQNQFLSFYETIVLIKEKKKIIDQLSIE